MQTYSMVYFSLCLFLAISGRLRTQQKLNLREKFPMYGNITTLHAKIQHMQRDPKTASKLS